MDIDKALSQAKSLTRHNQREQARQLLGEILKEYPNSSEAWILSAEVSDELEQVLYCLQRASKINPKALETHPKAPQIRSMIKRLQQSSSLPADFPSQPQPDNIIVDAPTPVETFSPSLREIGGGDIPEARTEDAVPIVKQINPPTKPVKNRAQEKQMVRSTRSAARKRKAVWPWVIIMLLLIGLVAGGILFRDRLTGLFIPGTVAISTPTMPVTAIETKVSPIDGMTMVMIAAGDFIMGGNPGDLLVICSQYYNDCNLSWFTAEEPAHHVNLGAYWIDQTEVTNAMYSKCVQAGICLAPGDTSSATRTDYFGNQQFADYPVIYVNQNDAQTYCEWAGKKLPTEAEWEKAARGENGYVYPWGDATPNCTLVNYLDSTGAPCEGDTTKTGSYPGGTSTYGALDMSGNVWEWTADWYDASYYNNSPTANPTGPISGTSRVMRGGSWLFNGYYLRTSNRGIGVPTLRNDNLGFRCAQAAP